MKWLLASGTGRRATITFNEFVKTTAEEGLMILRRSQLCRIGNSGYPWWLQKTPGLVIRTDNPAVPRFVPHVHQPARWSSCTTSKSLTADHRDVQAENEFGSYAAQGTFRLETHKKYQCAIRQQLLDAGFYPDVYRRQLALQRRHHRRRAAHRQWRQRGQSEEGGQRISRVR